MGLVNFFEAVRHTPGIKAVVNVTSDKCYENKEWAWGYRENEAFGGYGPLQQTARPAAELVTAGYRSSFFNPEKYADHGVALASGRAGNVIGGGDWAEDRLIPDMVRAIAARQAGAHPQPARDPSVAACAGAAIRLPDPGRTPLHAGRRVRRRLQLRPARHRRAPGRNGSSRACAKAGAKGRQLGAGQRAPAARGALPQARLLESPRPPAMAAALATWATPST